MPDLQPPGLPVRPYGRLRVDAPTGEEAAAFDRWAIDEVGVPEPVLMENAGRSAAAVAERLFSGRRVVGLVGGGNNGGDALVVLRTLAARGWDASVVTVTDRSSPDPLQHGWELTTVRDRDLESDGAWDERLGRADLLVDGMLGTGIRGAPRERQAAAVRAVNRASAPVLSLDVPSGVDAGTGAVPGDAVVADATVAFGWPKLGTLLHPGRERAGRLVAVEIGFPPGEEGPSCAARVVTPTWVEAHRPRRPTETHKYEVGSLFLLAGREGMAGAAVMAARAALRTGVGLLRIGSDPSNRVILQQAVPEAIFLDAGDAGAVREGVQRSGAVAAGPGIGTDARGEAALETVLGVPGDRPVLLDADALTLAGAGRAPGLEELGADRTVLVTPHPGEMSRIAPHGKERIRTHRVEVATETAARTGCTVLLKGFPSLVASPGGRVLVDSAGTSALATGGMGDVLTGICGAFLARGVEPALHAGALGLHHGGRAAERAGRHEGLLPDDVVAHLPEALEEKGPGTSDLDLPWVVFDQDPPR